MQLQKLLGLVSLISTTYAGLLIQGFADSGDNGNPGCQQQLSNVIIDSDGECVSFPGFQVYSAISLAGGTPDCILEVFEDDICQKQSSSNIGPIDSKDLEGCIGPFPFDNGDNTFSLLPAASARTANCSPN
ncbi:hypothetical protein N431DRAFT_488879 [Stipitochalara longipes BDJ]|nr:hypothetical protein N431DRAFT_488879 [Stipitochalara longipes BDJ]